MTANKGFALWEVLLVIIIVGVLGSVVLPSYLNYSENAVEASFADTTEADNALRNMVPANIAFNPPKVMEVGQTHTIELLLSLNESLDELANKIKERSLISGRPIETATVRVSNIVEAKLTGQKFKILAIAEEEQAITKTESTQWKWQIEAISSGTHKLHLVLNTSVTIEGERIARTIRTFDRDIEVTVKLENQVKTFIANNWQWLWATFLVPIAGFFWNRWNKKQKAE